MPGWADAPSPTPISQRPRRTPHRHAHPRQRPGRTWSSTRTTPREQVVGVDDRSRACRWRSYRSRRWNGLSSCGVRVVPSSTPHDARTATRRRDRRRPASGGSRNRRCTRATSELVWGEALSGSWNWPGLGVQFGGPAGSGLALLAGVAGVGGVRPGLGGGPRQRSGASRGKAAAAASASGVIHATGRATRLAAAADGAVTADGAAVTDAAAAAVSDGGAVSVGGAAANRGAVADAALASAADWAAVADAGVGVTAVRSRSGFWCF